MSWWRLCVVPRVGAEVVALGGDVPSPVGDLLLALSSSFYLSLLPSPNSPPLTTYITLKLFAQLLALAFCFRVWTREFLLFISRRLLLRKQNMDKHFSFQKTPSRTGQARVDMRRTTDRARNQRQKCSRTRLTFAPGPTVTRAARDPGISLSACRWRPGRVGSRRSV